MYVNSQTGLSIKFAWLILAKLYIALFIFSSVFFLLFITPELQPVLWTYLLSCGGIILYILTAHDENFRLLPKISVKTSTLSLALLAAISVFIIRDILLQLLTLPNVTVLSFAAVRTDSFVAIIGSVFLVPLLEEMLFRGIILEALYKRYQAMPALLISSLLFALATLNPAYLVPNFLLGMVCGLFYLRLRDLCLGIFIRLLCNMATAVILINNKTGLADLLNDGALYFIFVLVAFTLAPPVYYLLQRVNGHFTFRIKDRQV